MLKRMILLGMAGAGAMASGSMCRLALGVDNTRPAVRQMDDDDNKKEDKDEQKVPVDQLPQAVVDTVKKEVPDGTITDAEKEKKHDKVVYEVDVKTSDTKYEVKTREDGKFISKKVDDDDDDDAKK